MKFIVIGFDTITHDVESWGFDDEILVKRFCEQLSESTGRSVWVLTGEIIGKYEVNFNVEYKTWPFYPDKK